MSENQNPVFHDQTVGPSPEALTMQELDATAQHIFDKNQYNTLPLSPYSQLPEGSLIDTVSRDVPSQNSSRFVTLRRTTTPDGAVSYEFSDTARIWYESSGDRGGSSLKWTKGGDTLTDHTSFDTAEPIPPIDTPQDLASMRKFANELNTIWLKPEAARAPGKLRRLLGRIGLRHA